MKLRVSVLLAILGLLLLSLILLRDELHRRELARRDEAAMRAFGTNGGALP